MPVLKWTNEQKDKIKQMQRKVLWEVKQTNDPKVIANAAYDPRLFLRPNQAPYLYGYPDFDMWLFIAGRSAGKAICKDTPCLTRNKGWIRYGNLEIGDEVFTENGQPTKVLALYDNPANLNKRYYKVHFNDGSSIDACEDHLWHTWTHQERKQYLRQDRKTNQEKPIDYPANWATYDDGKYIKTKTRTTAELFDTLKYGIRLDNNHSIPLCKPCDMPEQDLPIDPYVMGLWLANGYHSSGEIWAHLDDAEFIYDYISQKYNCVNKHMKNKTSKIIVYDIVPKLRELDVYANKHIPAIYLHGSIEQRIALLRGFMDGDGCFERSASKLYNTNKDIIDGFKKVLGSLGIKYFETSKIGKIKGVEHKKCYALSFYPLDINPFLNPRKAEKWVGWRNNKKSVFFRSRARIITDIKLILPKDMMCITVDNPSAMYLIGDECIPTHNTHAGVQWILHILKHTEQEENICVLCPDHNSIIKVMVEGNSGFLKNTPRYYNLVWRKTDTTLEFTINKRLHYVRFFTSENPERIRGNNFTRALMDEVAAYSSVLYGKFWEEISQVELSTRIGYHPQIAVTTTPKNMSWLVTQIESAKIDPNIIVTTGSSYDNRENLGDAFIKRLESWDKNSDRYKQEVLGELILTEGQQWVREEKIRIWDPMQPLPRFERVIVAIDSAFEEKNIRKNDPSGIMVVGLYYCYEQNQWSLMVLDLIIEYLNTPDLVEFVKDLWWTPFGGDGAKRYPDLLLIENNASGKPLAQYLWKHQIPATYFYTKNQSKSSRFSAVIPMIDEGRLCVIGGLDSKYAEWIQKYVTKLATYPNMPLDEDGVAHDEEIDLTSMIFLVAQENNFVDIKYPSRPLFDPVEPKDIDYDLNNMVNPYSI
jgi:phage terminase large subunit-like protein